MTLYKWDSFSKKFAPSPLRQHIAKGECVVLKSVEMTKGERLSVEGGSDRFFCLLSGALRVTTPSGEFIVRDNEAVMIPAGFLHSAEAIEDSRALQLVRKANGADDYLWGV
jgi:mannose-6-phosphate isomerase-like protein (cupin superfamily)